LANIKSWLALDTAPSLALITEVVFDEKRDKKSNKMVFFASIGVGILTYGVLHTFLTCICDCDLRLKFAEIFGKNIGNYFKIYVMTIGSMPIFQEHCKER
jgi:hypothetical protein